MARRHITLPDSFEELFIRLEEVILANSGEDEFEEIFKLITFKLWTEQNKRDVLNISKNNIKEVVEKELKEINKNWSGVLRDTEVKLKPEHLKICIDILEKFKLINEGFEAIDAFFEYIVSKIKKGSKGQYFTPRYVVDFCIRVLNPKFGERILDPASGSGAFLLHSYDYILKNQADLKKEQQESIGEKLWGFDFDDKAIRISKLLMYVSGVNKFNIHKSNSLFQLKIQEKALLEGKEIEVSTIEDYLRINKVNGLFDVIITNPPFAGEIVEEDLLNCYEVSKDKTRVERDVLFIERCITLLKSGGRMAIILPDNKFGGSDWAYLRKWIIKKAQIIGVVGLPRNTFMPHTPVKTSILFLEKRKGEKSKGDEKIFFGISEKSGKDTRGNLIFKDDKNENWNNIDHDLNEIEIEFEKFLNAENMKWGD